MPVTSETDPPTADPPEGDPPPTGLRTGGSTEPPRRRSKFSEQTIGGLIGAAVTAGATIIAAFVGINNETIIVPAVDNRPIDVLTEKIDDLQTSVNQLSGENEGLEVKVQERDAKIAQLEAEEPTSPPSTPPEEPEVIYADQPVALVGSDESGRTAFVELDGAPVADTMLASEWDETRSAGGPTADIGTYGTFHGDELAWSRTGTWYSKVSAPADSAMCREGANDSDESEVTLEFLAVGDVICLLTTEDGVARLTVTKVDAESSPGRLEFSATLWK